MPFSSSQSRSQHDAASSSTVTLPLVLLIASLLAQIGTSPKHAILTSAVAWLAVCTYTTLKIGARSSLDGSSSQRLAWGAGVCLAVAGICERAVDGRAIWWAKVLIPLLIFLSTKAGILEHAQPASSSPPSSPTKPGSVRACHELVSKRTLAIITGSGLVAVYTHSGSISVIALGLSYAVVQALALHLVEGARYQSHDVGGVIYSANGLLTQPVMPLASAANQWMSLLRDVSASAGATLGVAALTLENLRFGGLAYWGLMGKIMGDHWVFGQSIISVVHALGTVMIQVVMFAALLLMVNDQGAFLTSFVPLAATLASQLLLAFSTSRLYFAALCIGGTFSLLNEQGTFLGGGRMRIRISKLLTVVAAVSFVVLTFYYLLQPIQNASLRAHGPQATVGLNVAPPVTLLEPLQSADTRTHPVRTLVQDAQRSWSSKLQSQSQSLEAAVTEYKRRYGLAPPPHFDKWYEFAKRKKVQLVDEYDTIYHSLLPFWGLAPATIRARAREALGFGDNNLMGLLVREGKAFHVEGGQEWLQQAAVGMMEQFIEYLPDMDLAFNVHDEPRVVVPHDQLCRLLQVALEKNVPAAIAQTTPKNTFSARPKDVKSGKRIEEVKTTRFNVFAHQPTWIPSRLSCSPDSPARMLEESLATDNLTAYSLSELGFIYNHTSFSDICNSPSFGQSHGFFDRPNAFNVVHDLFPIFSQSKMSSFQDIVYPSPWYWYGKVKYDESKDLDWEKKENKLWWRGSTTGGFSRAGGWRRQHRQKFVGKVNALDNAKVLRSSNAAATDEDPGSKWIVKDVPRQDYQEIMDVHFSHVGQCDPGDCDAQREFFKVVEPADQQEAWRYKYLLDMDGNAFSGRFYAFLMSHSLPFKMAVFREWHEEWLKPWVHYIPLSLRADEALEAVRYLDAEEDGKPLATTIAETGREWGHKALRNEDFEVWLFRLLLEYGRVIDDDRESIGYTGA
ncbi:Beta-1,2-xylosyltransferase 1 [Fulvia fulva]|nr:Beta-1,2-xylosyltransferase 1 [Fulvia fulva]WPV09775.1 Beta-1,2-xylosyltransferase 1 [Fulvia fulva]WPV24653.1 Beta-1,2-xylosyltransferase 1 [Fulvia fulva]